VRRQRVVKFPYYYIVLRGTYSCTMHVLRTVMPHSLHIGTAVYMRSRLPIVGFGLGRRFDLVLLAIDSLVAVRVEVAGFVKSSL
jgi:hypothetical protein